MGNKKDFKDSILGRYGFFLHKNLGIHLVITLVFNVIAILAITGLSILIDYKIFDYSVTGLIFYIIAITLIEITLKIFIIRHFLNIVLQTKGILVIVLHLSIFYFTTFLINDVKILPNVIIKSLLLTILFLVFRISFVIIFQRYTLRNKN